MVNLIWFRNNLRTQDHEALAMALQTQKPVIGLYCLDPKQFQETAFGFKKTEKFRARFLLETLRELKNALAELHVPLYVLHQSPEEAFQAMVQEHKILHVYTQKEWTSEEVVVQQNMQKLFPQLSWHEFYDQFLFHPEDIPYEFHKIPEVFTEFRKKCEQQVKIRPLQTSHAQAKAYYFQTSQIIPTLEDLGLDSFKTHKNTAFPFKGGENKAQKRIDHYFFETENLSRYKQTRNGLIGESYSSKLSAWLANGSISAKKIYWEVKEYEKQVGANEDTYWLIFELIWRDYFKYISLKHGNKIFQLHGIVKNRYDWKFNPKAFRQWVYGNTREPFVNAKMIELMKTGFFSKPCRQKEGNLMVQSWQAKCGKLLGQRMGTRLACGSCLF